jgi:hypothetical protein
MAGLGTERKLGAVHETSGNAHITDIIINY